MSPNIPVFNLTRQFKNIRKPINNAMAKVFQSGKFILSDETSNFEKNFAKYIDAKYGIGVNSGTDAIKIALRAMGIKPGDQIITVANTAVPTVSAIREVGGIPIFIDIDDYFTLDDSRLQGLLSKKVKAVVVVHIYGQPANMKNVMRFAEKHKIKILEDCAQATGAMIGNKKVGTFGDVSCFSFYPTKNLGAYGDGGMILTSNKTLANKCRELRMYGMRKTYYSNVEGYNSRLDELQAAILNTKLPMVDIWNERRSEIAQYYFKNIINTHIRLPELRPHSKHVFHLFVIRTKRRKSFLKHLVNNGIGYGIHYPYPIHLQKAYKSLGYQHGSLPKTETAAKEIVSLPIFPELTNKEVKRITKVVNNYLPE